MAPATYFWRTRESVPQSGRPIAMTHPANLHAVAALWSLRRARRYLADHRETTLYSRPHIGPSTTRPQPRSLAQLAAYDELLRNERPDRIGLAGAKMSAAPAPIAPVLLDLDREVSSVLVDVFELLSHIFRSDRLLRH